VVKEFLDPPPREQPTGSRYVCRHESSGMADFPPARMLVCDCGANAECPVCGYSFGAWPCGCDGIVAERKRGWTPNA
jgi:hypothetical protein